MDRLGTLYHAVRCQQLALWPEYVPIERVATWPTLPSHHRHYDRCPDMGIDVNMPTGDGREMALVVAQQVGIGPEGV